MLVGNEDQRLMLLCALCPNCVGGRLKHTHTHHDVQVPIPKTMRILVSHGKKDFEDVIKIRDLSDEKIRLGYPGRSTVIV